MPNSTVQDFEALLPRFGLAEFRQGQREVIEAVLAGQDCLCVMPTGGGKSLCYQLPAVARDGVTLVVSPLIALMQDQVQQLQALGLRATFINSTLETSEQNNRLDQMAAGRYDLVYVAAERFRSSRFIEATQASRLQLLAIDEAHCISEWGHDFRPDYARLGRYRARLGNPPTIALTATATDAVRRDIIEQLDLAEPRIFITGFARPNLFYEVENPSGQKQKDEALVSFLKEAGKPGIIYASTRKRCEEVAQTIRDQTKLRVAVYHAGMLHEDRRQSQEAFMSGEIDAVVATNAFGMGIDKADVRFVLHYNLPGTLEAYYQEAGRAGRDGEPSRCLLLYSAGDRYIQEFFIDSAYPPREVVKAVYEFLRKIDQDPIELTQQEIKEALNLGIGAEGIGTCEQLLEKAGVLERLEPRQNMAIVRIDSELPTLVDMLPKQATTQRKVLQAIERLIGPRRNEMVYFRPGDLQERTGLDPAGLGRALRELKHLPAFDYIPPFRGRAIHFVDKTRRFEELDIDFEALEERKSQEFDKLERVISFARTTQCRQEVILKYFGQHDSSACGHCDNCGPQHAKSKPLGESVAADDPAILDAVRKALSGVARTHSRYGKHLVAQMLCGSKSTKVTKARLHLLSTYGLMSPLRQEEVVCLLDSLLTAGLLEQIDSSFQRPVLHLTERGTLVMRDQATVERLRIPAELANRIRALARGTKPRREAKSGVEKSARHESAQEINHRTTNQRDLPQPDSPVTTQPVRQSPTPEVFQPPALTSNVTTVSPAAAGHPTHYWTWRLLTSGFSPGECATIRGIDEDSVLDHATRAAEAGETVDCGWFLTMDQQAAISAVIGPETPSRIRPLLDRMPPGIRYGHVQWFLACRRNVGAKR